MPPADRPRLTRPLAGVDQALGEGRAREPTELLDQLRERLDRLNPNHPSARPSEAPVSPVEETASVRETASPAEEAARPAESARDLRPKSPSLRKETADQSSGSGPVDRDAGASPTAEQAGEPATLASAQDQYRVVDISRAGQGERYRPWFTDDPGAPWFIE